MKLRRQSIWEFIGNLKFNNKCNKMKQYECLKKYYHLAYAL
jgi:hypothetical protein